MAVHRSSTTSRYSNWRVVVAVSLLVLAILLFAQSWRSAPADVQLNQQPDQVLTTTPSPSDSALVSVAPSPSSLAQRLPKPCRQQTAEVFTPVSISILGVGTWPVVSAPRDAENRPDVDNVPLWSFAWDMQSPPPNYGRGVFYGGAHRYGGGDSLGNLMLEQLRVGDIVVLRGAGGDRLCLQMQERKTIPLKEYPIGEVFNVTRRPQLYVFDICNGVRSDSGDWSHATLLWFTPLK